MEEENNRTEISIKTSPHRERICKCGCGESFIPKRRDQVYKTQGMQTMPIITENENKRPLVKKLLKVN